MRHIVIVNQSSKVNAAQLKALVAALQAQVNGHFAPVYGIDCQLSSIQASPGTPYNVGQHEAIYLMDHSDQADALGYHTDSQSGLPVGYAFVEDTISNGLPWQPTVSHELIEQLADPWCNLTCPAMLSAAFGQDAGQWGIVGYETADPVEEDHYLLDGVPVSNFVWPAWWSGQGHQYDQMRLLTAPLTLTQGGYVSYCVDLSKGFTQVTAREGFAKHGYSRFHRRRQQHAKRAAA